MTITYTVEEYLEEDKTVKVTYYNEEGFVHTRSVNIPHNSDGSIDEEYFEEILEGQLRGVENKLKVGAITFIDPTPQGPTSDLTETLT
jgi:hypothetical protein